MPAIRVSGSISDDLNEAVEHAMDKTGKRFSSILQEALTEKLQRDGFLNSAEAKEREILNIARGLQEEGIDVLSILTEAGERKLQEEAS